MGGGHRARVPLNGARGDIQPPPRARAPRRLPRAQTAGILTPLHIRDIHARGKLPIVVGGTFYYVNALLWEAGVADTSTAAVQSSRGAGDEKTAQARSLIQRPDPTSREERDVRGRGS